MRSVADELREEQRREILDMTPAERIELALRLGEEALQMYMAAHGVDRATAYVQIKELRRAGRRPSRCMDEP